VRERTVGRSRLSSGHQLTIPIGPFRAAALAPGDQFEVIADGPGRVRLERVHPAEPLTTPAGPAPEEAA
jgi:bifunctional DNA-binding transcriptional regulator/antitoxin component of YhaV-PrlF toxin-antitoxin module